MDRAVRKVGILEKEGIIMPKTGLFLLIALAVTVAPGRSQSRRSASAAQAERAAGGRVTATIHPWEEPGSLDMLIHMSRLIVDATVSDVPPAVVPNINLDLPLVETYALVTVNEVLSAVAIPGPTSLPLFVVQEGGMAGKWEVITPEAPLLQKGERYILFLAPDDRATFYNPATPRYNAVGVWSGMVSVQNGKVAFQPRAAAALHDNDNMTVEGFLALVRSRVAAIVPKDQIILPHPIHVPPEALQQAQRAAGQAK